MKTILSVVMSLMAFIAPLALNGQFGFVVNPDGASVSIANYTGLGGVVVIPGVVSNLSVTTIGPHAFAYAYGITSVSVANSITQIADEAFLDCTGYYRPADRH